MKIAKAVSPSGQEQRIYLGAGSEDQHHCSPEGNWAYLYGYDLAQALFRATLYLRMMRERWEERSEQCPPQKQTSSIVFYLHSSLLSSKIPVVQDKIWRCSLINDLFSRLAERWMKTNTPLRIEKCSLDRWEASLRETHSSRVPLAAVACTSLRSWGWSQNYPMTPPEKAAGFFSLSWVCPCCQQPLRFTDCLFCTYRDRSFPGTQSFAYLVRHKQHKPIRFCSAIVGAVLGFHQPREDEIRWFMQVSDLFPQSVEVWHVQ